MTLIDIIHKIKNLDHKLIRKKTYFSKGNFGYKEYNCTHCGYMICIIFSKRHRWLVAGIIHKIKQNNKSISYDVILHTDQYYSSCKKVELMKKQIIMKKACE